VLFSDDSRLVSIAITQRKPRVRVIVPESERRRSGRERVAINYAEKYGLDDEEDVAAARRRGAAASGRKKPKLAQLTDGDFARRRFSVGARVYDSELGVTCHWCRQKTVETHVFCTAEACGKGRRAPLAFCGMCLRNRHGEDVDAAVASGIWECPRCRGSCGDGCVTCCNCGPCRKAHGLAPTHQVIQLARGAGFDNVHDYLVHGATGLTPAALLARKRSFNWGKWLAEGFEPPAPRRRRRARAKPRSRRHPRRHPRRRSARRTSRTSRVVDVAAELRVRRAVALAEKDAAEDASAATNSLRAPATPSPAKGALVQSRKRPWAVAASSLPSPRSRENEAEARPASPATPEADAGAGARESRARRAASRHSKALFPDAPGASAASTSPEPLVRGSSPGKARAVASRQGDIRAMFAAREGGAARATRARAAGAA
jgi:hypothetical protein